MRENLSVPEFPGLNILKALLKVVSEPKKDGCFRLLWPLSETNPLTTFKTFHLDGNSKFTENKTED